MCQDRDSEREVPPNYRNTPEFQAAWRRVEAFEASQPVAEKRAYLIANLARTAEIIDAEGSASMNCAQVQLAALLRRIRDLPPSTSRAEFNLLNDEALSFILSEPTLFAAYDVAMSLESLEGVTPQLDALRSEGEQRPISDGERHLRKVLEDLAAMLNEAVRDGLRRLHATD